MSTLKGCKYRRMKKHLTDKTKFFCVIRNSICRYDEYRLFLCKDFQQGTKTPIPKNKSLVVV